MSAFTGDKRFEDEYNEIIKESGEYTMCGILDKAEERGRREGRQEMSEFTVLNMLKKGKYTREEISKCTGVSMDTIGELEKSLQ